MEKKSEEIVEVNLKNACRAYAFVKVLKAIYKELANCYPATSFASQQHYFDPMQKASQDIWM